MRSFTYSLFAAATFLYPQVYAGSADPLAVQTVQAQFEGAKIVPDAIPAFDPVGLLNLDFKSTVGLTTIGQAIGKENVTEQPVLTSDGAFNGTSTKYTVLMVDANYVGSSNPDGLNLHWLQNDVALGSDGTLSAAGSATIPYAGPGPAAGSGPHRYTVLLYAQPADFVAPATPKANSGVNPIDLAQYVSDAKLSEPLAGSYFTVEVGTATVAVGSTTPVNPSTIAVSNTGTPTGTGSGSKTPSPTGSSTNSGTSSTPTNTPNGASKTNGAAYGGALFSVLGAVFLLA